MSDISGKTDKILTKIFNRKCIFGQRSSAFINIIITVTYRAPFTGAQQAYGRYFAEILK